MGPFGGSVLSIVVDPHNPAVLLAGARNGQFFRSTDRGASWTQISFGRFLAGNVQVVAIDPDEAGHYWAGVSGENAGSNGLWESRDGGVSWTQSLAGLPIESFAQFSGSGGIVAAGTRRGLYVRNGAGDWRRITPADHAELQDVVSVAFDRADARVIYAGTPHLPWKSTDGGATWSSIHEGMLDDSDVFSLHVSRANPARVFASACSGIYRSQNAGERWRLLEGIPNGSRRTHIILEDPRDPNVVYAGTTNGLFRSTDGGERWEQLTKDQVNSIALDPGDTRIVYAATEHAGVQISSNRGDSFRASNQGIHARNISAVTNSGSLLYIGTAYEDVEGGVFVGSGAGWRRVAEPKAFGGANVRAMTSSVGPAPGEAGASRIYAAADGRVYSSKDYGRTWSSAAGKLPEGITAVSANGDVLWAGTTGGLYRGPGEWKKVATVGNDRIHAIDAAGTQLLARSDHAVYLSADAGTSWRKLEAPSLFDAAVSCEGNVLLARSQSLVVSVNGGPARVPAGLPESTVSSVTFDPYDCRQAYAIQFGRLYTSEDGGLNWLPAEDVEGLPEAAKIWIPPTDPGTLYAIVPGAGIFTRDVRR